jgi:hypothetical protein
MSIEYKIEKYSSKYQNSDDNNKKQVYLQKLNYYNDKLLSGGAVNIFGSDNCALYITMHVRQSVQGAVNLRINKINGQYPNSIQPTVNGSHITLFTLVVSKATADYIIFNAKKDVQFYQNLVQFIRHVLDTSKLTLNSAPHQKHTYKQLAVFLVRNFTDIVDVNGANVGVAPVANINTQIFTMIKSYLFGTNRVNSQIRTVAPTTTSSPPMQYSIVDNYNQPRGNKYSIASPDYNIRWAPHLSMAFINASTRNNPTLLSSIINFINTPDPQLMGPNQLSNINLWSENKSHNALVQRNTGLVLEPHRGHISNIEISIICPTQAPIYLYTEPL